MFIVSESGTAIFNVNTSTIISIYKFGSGGETKWAVCADYPADTETYHLLTNRTENREVAVAVLKRIIEAIKNGDEFLDLSDEQERDDKTPTRADMIQVIDNFCDIFLKKNTCMNCKFLTYCTQLTWKEMPDSMISEIYKEILENEQR